MSDRRPPPLVQKGSQAKDPRAWHAQGQSPSTVTRAKANQNRTTHQNLRRHDECERTLLKRP